MKQPDPAVIKAMREKLTQQNKDAARALLLVLQNQVSSVSMSKNR